MTLLEGILATVLLAVVAVACLDGTRGAAQLQQRSSARVDALVAASTALEAATVNVGEMDGSRDAVRTRRSSYRAPISSEAAFGGGSTFARSNDATSLVRVDVEVALPDGGRVQVSRLVEAPRTARIGAAGAPR